ncbi:MAG TPA: anti-sigma factor [Solirubrobacteraceae bacterium]
MSADERHERFAEDVAAYVLGALGEDEHDTFVAHLSSCAVCRDEVAALQRVASALPSAVPQLASPPELKRRVMDTVRVEAGLREPRVAASARSQSGGSRWSRGEGARVGRRAPGSRRGALGALAGLAAIAIAIAIAVAGSDGGSSSRVIQAQVTVPHATVAVKLSGGHAELDVAGMPQSPRDHVYEVWIKRSGDAQPTDALFTVSAAGRATVGVPGSISGVKQIMVTAEPRGGSVVPTSKPVIVASL